MPPSLTLLASVLSAVLLWAASPAVGLGWLAWIALVPVATVTLGAQHPRLRRMAVPLTYALYLELLLIPALPFGLTRGEWGEPVAPVLVGHSPVLFVAAVFVPLVGTLLYLIRFGEPWAADRVSGRLRDVMIVLVPACAWTGLDYLRVKIDPSGLWGPLFLTQADRSAGRMASLAGPWLLTFLIVAVNYMLALALVRRRMAPGIAGVVILTITAFGGPLTGCSRAQPSLQVAVIQPGYDRVETLRSSDAAATDDARRVKLARLATDLRTLTRRAVARDASLIVLPEAVRYLSGEAPESGLDDLSEPLASHDALLVTPYFVPRKARSQVILMSGDGRTTAPNVKLRPMWYLGEKGGDLAPEPLEADGLRVGTLLGIDAADPLIPARLARNGARILVSSTHDWQASSRQHRAAARISATAVGRTLARADWRYGSAIFGPNGDILADTGTHRVRAIAMAQVPLTDTTTIYVRIGDLSALSAAAVACGAWLAMAVSFLGRSRRPLRDA